MRKLNNYIVEKLHIDKNTKVEICKYYIVCALRDAYTIVQREGNYEAELDECVFVYTRDTLKEESAIYTNEKYKSFIGIYKTDCESLGEVINEYNKHNTKEKYGYIKTLEHVKYEEL